MDHPIVSHDEWLAARRALLEKEKAFTRQGDELSRLARELPWEAVTKTDENRDRFPGAPCRSAYTLILASVEGAAAKRSPHEEH
jgi:predicted dithiol-disulfide oxidoreductase (DUF899 family)